MIKNKNIASDAGIFPGKIMGNGVFSSGDVFYTIKPGSAAEGFLKGRVPSENVSATIQGGIDKTIAYRGDTVVITPGFDTSGSSGSKWKEQVKVVSKSNIRLVHSISAGYGDQMRPGDSTTKYTCTTKTGQESSYQFNILSRNVEISGMFVDGGGGYGGIYVGGGLNGGVTGYTTETCHNVYFHDNFFRGGGEGKVGIYMNGPKFGNRIEDNFFERWTEGAINMDAGNASTEYAIVSRNSFLAGSSGYGILTYGEANSAIGVQVKDNYFSDRTAAAFTFAIKQGTGSSGVMSVLNNYFACNLKMSLIATDFTSGNYYGWAGDPTEDSNYFLVEATGGTT